MIISFPFLLNHRPASSAHSVFPSPFLSSSSLAERIDIIATRKKSWPVKAECVPAARLSPIIRRVFFTAPLKRENHRFCPCFCLPRGISGELKLIVSADQVEGGLHQDRTLFRARRFHRVSTRRVISIYKDDDKLTISRRASATLSLSLSLFNVIALRLEKLFQLSWN